MYSPPDPAAYNTIVYQIVRQISPGRVVAYGQIANMIPPPAGVDPIQYARLAPRWVGTAMANCPPDIPWQRVINSQGKISSRKYRDGHLRQRALLEAEGVVFDQAGRVDWDRFEWAGPPADWLATRGLHPLPRKSSRTARRKSSRSYLL